MQISGCLCVSVLQISPSWRSGWCQKALWAPRCGSMAGNRSPSSLSSGIRAMALFIWAGGWSGWPSAASPGKGNNSWWQKDWIGWFSDPLLSGWHQRLYCLSTGKVSQVKARSISLEVQLGNKSLWWQLRLPMNVIWANQEVNQP